MLKIHTKNSTEEQFNTTQLDTNSNRLPNTTHPHYGSVFSSSGVFKSTCHRLCNVTN